MPVITHDVVTDQLVAKGDLDQTTVPDECRETLKLGAERDYQMDLSGIERIDSAGLALLINLSQRQQAAGGSIRYTNCPDKVVQLVDMSELNDVIHLESN